MEYLSDIMENNLEEKPKQYLGLAVVSTLFFWPLGIVAVIKALKVDDYLALNNKEMAFYASQDAKKFGIISLLIGLTGYILITCIAVIGLIIANFT